jgi:hypothetical protein
MVNDNKVELMTQLGSVLVRVGHRDLAGASFRLTEASAMLRRIVERRGKSLETPVPKVGSAGVANLTALVVAAITRISKNDLQGAYERICESIVMVRRLTELQEARRQRRVDALGGD